ncbi:MAG: hypothetical protein H0V01_13355 [Bacteroidetes bacterium]|nr:hypothetical protein [Bacteroidota bacterium]HET6244102.1 hypothetical protein [Bacteroidia bacterium]
MSQTYNLKDLLSFIEDDALLEELINGADFEHGPQPSSFAISNILNYSKVLSVSGSEYCKNIEMVLN